MRRSAIGMGLAHVSPFLRMSDDGGQGGGGNGGGQGDQGAGGNGAGGAGGDTSFVDPDDGEKYAFPKDTPIKDMTADQQAEYWRHKARKHESAAKARSDYDQQKADAEKWRQAQREQLPADQRALEEAKESAKAEGRAEERRTMGSRLVAAEIKAAVAGRLTAEQVAALTEPLDLSKFLTDTGEVNTDMVTRYVSSIAPDGTDSKTQQQRWRAPGAGHRQPSELSKREQGAAEAQRRFGDKSKRQA